jgi:hypothetical protein
MVSFMKAAACPASQSNPSARQSVNYLNADDVHRFSRMTSTPVPDHDVRGWRECLAAPSEKGLRIKVIQQQADLFDYSS